MGNHSFDCALCRTTQFDEIVRFVTRLNGQPEHHIGFFGSREDDIRQTLAALDPPVHESFVAAEEDGALVGLMGVEFDVEIGRAWLFGPLVDHPDWQILADQLYDAVKPLLPDDIHELDIFCDIHNQNCRTFATKHGFLMRKEAAILNLSRELFGPVPPMAAEPYAEIYFSQLEALHDLLFPETYYTAQQMVEKQDAETHLLVAAANGQLQGYIFFKVEPEAGQGYIDFIGVAEPYRNRGIGKRLLAAAVRVMAATPEVQVISLTTTPSNAGAMQLYAGMGFTMERTMAAFRKELG